MQNEDLSLKYGKVRNTNDIDQILDSEQITDQEYVKVISFIDACVNNSIIGYSMQQIQFPGQIFGGDGPNCNVYMSKEFHSPDISLN